VTVVRDTVRVALAGAVVAVLAAVLVVVFGVGEAVRGWYGLTPDRPLRIGPVALWLHNLRALLPVFTAAAAVSWWPRARAALDVVIAAVVGGNVLLVAVALGAYGRPLWDLGPGHYPLELLAVAIAVAGYLDARRASLMRRGVLLVSIGMSAVVLATAAVLESAGAG
jgi:hypothetical protein